MEEEELRKSLHQASIENHIKGQKLSNSSTKSFGDVHNSNLCFVLFSRHSNHRLYFSGNGSTSLLICSAYSLVASNLESQDCFLTRMFLPRNQQSHLHFDFRSPETEAQCVEL